MQVNRMKIYHISLCLFFVLGGFGTAFLNGEQAQTYPDTSWNTPKNFVGYHNNYINQKINPSTMGDILITEYVEHPQEATGIVPLFPTQSVVQEMDYINTTVSDMTLELIPVQYWMLLNDQCILKQLF